MRQLLKDQKFRNIFFVDGRTHWVSVEGYYDPALDLVLTFDLALKKQIETHSGFVEYIDFLIAPDLMQAENHNIYRFFRNWHDDSNGRDLFSFREMDFGFMFRLEIWNDFTFALRLWINLRVIDRLTYQKLYVASQNEELKKILIAQKKEFTLVGSNLAETVAGIEYFFPIHKWMDQAIRANDVRAYLRNLFFFLVSWGVVGLEKFRILKANKRIVFVQKYHPTRRIIQSLIDQDEVTVALEGFLDFKNWKSYFKERQIPLSFKGKRWNRLGEELLLKFQTDATQRLVLNSGEDVTDFIRSLFVNRLRPRIAHYLYILDAIERYFSKRELKLEIMIANIGLINGAVDAYCKKNGIPSFMIINGILGSDYLDEAKYATFINAYSEVIQTHYFKGMKNVMVLGDPRMDQYVRAPKRSLNRKKPTITIGASGFNNVDLNSYVAVEFDFLFDVLKALKTVKDDGNLMEIFLKVRPNGYRGQYEAFVEEYYPELQIKILDNTPMASVLNETDFYISIYSQTLFEASVLGIPVVYYRKDVEIMDPPFDGSSELVTVDNVENLKEVIQDYYRGSDRFDSFLQTATMEQYIGPLDGKNLERNLEFIQNLIK